ncbi:drug resistance transporter, EmrB/QacA subfamily [Kytococcus aerolatus]|uniref:Drug resistance transporter, EmrB/QacA subfamily n=1 Tax=Kytococcus aerolatus TaxID=592308 RepID=A0A212TAH7_9MICO|nr:MFS transporter [Kytococcus aerolatus]SNC63022.1 drug resistance transporter, EmrB/QacA subfamily [Kytococcus aerolatus]
MTTSPAPAPPAADARADGRLLAVLLVPLFMALLAVSVVNVALAPIGHSLEADDSALQWVVSGYALAFGVFLVPAGRLGDLMGRRPLFQLGVAVFTLGSLGAALAPTVELLNAARLLQGLGSGLINPQTIGLIQAHFRGQARARAFATMATTVALATAFGPVVGGLLIQLLGDELGWRWMFALNVPLGLVTLALARRWVPEDRVRTGGFPDIDPVGTVLLALSTLAFMWPFVERSGSSWWLLLPAAALTGSFVLWERRYRRRGGHPVVDLDMFRSRAFRNGIAIVSIHFLGATSIFLVIPLWLQMHLGHGALAAALALLPASVGSGFSAQVAGRHVLRMGRRLVIGGFLVVITALLLLVLLVPLIESGQLPWWTVCLSTLLIGLGQGSVVSPNTTLTLQAMDSRQGGVAGGLMSLGQRLGTAVGTALVPGVLFALVGAEAGWTDAFRATLLTIVALTLAATALSVLDLRRERQERHA